MLDNLIDILHEEESTVALRGVFFLAVSHSVLIVTSGEDHQRARAALNPAFTAIAVREFLPVLERTAEMVRLYRAHISLAQCLQPSQLTALLEDALVAKSPTDICPMVGTATLSAVSEGISAIVSVICYLFHRAAMFGCTLQDLGEELVTNYRHLMCDRDRL
jgi:hypothetical protein